MGLERSIQTGLQFIGQGCLVNSHGIHRRGRATYVSKAQLQVHALRILRPDARTAGFEGCVLLVNDQPDLAIQVVARAAATSMDENLFGPLDLSLATGLRMLSRHTESLGIHRRCAKRATGHFRIMASLFATFAALRVGTRQDAAVCLESCYDASVDSISKAKNVLAPFLREQARRDPSLSASLHARMQGMDTYGTWSDLLRHSLKL